MSIGNASDRRFSRLGIGANGLSRSICLLRWRGVDSIADDGDPAIGEVSAYRSLAELPQKNAGPFKPALVPGVRIRHVEMPVGRVHDHVEDGRPHPRHKPCGDGNVRLGVDFEHVLVRQRELDPRVPHTTELVRPVLAVEFHDQTRGRLDDAFEVRPGRRQTSVHRHHFLEDRRRPIAGQESGRKHATSVRGDGQRARRVREEREDRQRFASEAVPRIVGIKHPHVRASDPRRRQLRIPGDPLTLRSANEHVLAAVRGRNERAVALSACEDDIARFVAHKQCSHHVPHAVVVILFPRSAVILVPCIAVSYLHDTDAVRQMVDDPDFIVARGCDGDRFQSDRHRSAIFQPVRQHAKDFQRIVGRVGGEQQVSAGRQRQRPHGTRFKEGKRGTRCGRIRRIGQHLGPRPTLQQRSTRSWLPPRRMRFPI